MKNKTKIWIITGLSLILIGCIIFAGVMSVLKWDFKGINTTKYETNTYDISEEFENISISTNTADILFILSDNGKCKVECIEEAKTKHTVLVQENTLNININDTRKWYDYISFFSFGTPKITVYLPLDKYALLTVNASTGDIEIPKEFTFDNIDIKSSTGDVNCNASTVNDLKIKLSTGHINVEDITVGNMNLITSTGSMNIKKVDCVGKIETRVSTGKTNLIDIKCESLLSKGSTGDMKLSNVIATKDFNVTRSTGNIKLDKCDAGDIFIKTDTGDVRGTLLTNKIFITETDTGDVSVPKTITGGKCEITTDTGDINFKVVK